MLTPLLSVPTCALFQVLQFTCLLPDLRGIAFGLPVPGNSVFRRLAQLPSLQLMDLKLKITFYIHFLGVRNKVPQKQLLTTTEMDVLTVLEAGNPNSRYWQGQAPSEGSGRRLRPCLCQHCLVFLGL